MTWLGGPDEIIVADRQARPELAVTGDDAVGERDRRDPELGGRALDLLAMLIAARQKADVPARRAPVARHGVGHDGRVGVA